MRSEDIKGFKDLWTYIKSLFQPKGITLYMKFHKQLQFRYRARNIYRRTKKETFNELTR